MKKLYATKAIINIGYAKIFVIACILFLFSSNSYGQVEVDFTPRTSVNSPSKTIYTIKGDFTMIGNTNLTLVNYSDNSNNDEDMRFVDRDDVVFPGNTFNTINSSSATLALSTENKADPGCSKIIYAGIYWTGRVDQGVDADADGDGNPNTFNVTKNGVTKQLDKRKIRIKGPDDNFYTDFTAEPTNEILFPENEYRNIFTGYTEITDYVQRNGIGEYFVGDLPGREGIIDGTGLSAGWGMVVVYENSKMKWRDITVFDGYAFVRSFNNNVYSIPVSGFNAAQSGEVNLKLGVMGGEGERGFTEDYFEIEQLNSGTYTRLSHSENTPNNFFTGSILTGGNPRDPNLYNNTGIDVMMFDIDNTGNTIIANGQTQTSFNYGTTFDTYTIFNVTFAVDAYVPEPEGVLNITSINGNTPNPPDILEPGQFSDYILEIRNTGTEATDNTLITIPVPDTIDPSNLNISTGFPNPGTYTTTNTPQYRTGPGFGPNGSIVWDLGTLPVPPAPDDVLATISFSLTVTRDCTMLSDPSFDPNVSLTGTITGVGAVSNVPFDFPLIQGYETTGNCAGEPIPTPIIIGINYLDYINEPPTASNPSPFDIECGATIPPPDVLVVTDEADNSGFTPTVTYVSDVSDGGTNPEIITRTYRVTDDCGNSIDVTQTITITDTTSPSTPTLPDLTGECSVTATAPTTGDICSGIITGTTTDPLTYNSQGTFVITWTFDDGNGNSIDVNQNIIVKDTTNPDTPRLAVLTGQCSVTAIAPTTEDNCSGTITGTTTDPLTYNSQGTFVITWTFDDGNGNSIDVDQTVIVDDTTEPEEPVLPDLNGQCSVTAPIPVITDNCNGAPISGTTSDPLIYNTQGTYVITWNFDDGNGNSINVDQNIIVNDTTNPDTPNLPVLTGQCSVTAVAPTTDDNCLGTITASTTNSTTYNTQGTYTITWTFDDGNGNSIDVDQTVIVDDTTNPETPRLEDLTGQCGVTAIAPTTNDNCSGIITGTTTDPTTYNTQGTFVITWTFDDGNGNSIDVDQTVIVDDTTEPEEPTLADLIGQCSVTAPIPVITDNCNGNTITGTTTDPLTYTTQGTFIITWNFDDGNGNSIDVDQTVIVEDTTNPTITCPADVSVNVDAGLCTASGVTLGTPIVDDNCSVDTVTNDAPAIYPLGNTIVTWTVTDDTGNTATCTQTVTVIDDIDPTITCPSNVSLNVDSGLCTASSVNLGTPITDDNCSVDTVTNDAPSVFPLGNTTVTWTVTDGSGNTAICTQTVTVTDDIDPTITCPADVSVGVDVGLCTASGVNLGIPTSDDNCSVDTITNDAPAVFPLGNTTVTWTVTDGSGNTATCTQTVTVTDDIDPTIICPADVSVNVDPGSCEASSVNLGTPTTDDNCSIDSVTNDAPTTYPLGDTIVTWTVTDGSGNTATCTQTVTVVDDADPSITCPIDVTVNVDAGLCSATNVDLGTPSATDCTPVTVSNDAPAVFPQGETIVTWTVSDDAGNTVTCTQVVTVIDNINPTFVEALPTDITVECSEIPDPEVLTATDNCGSAVVSFGETRIDGSCESNYTLVRTWTATDASGLTTVHTQNITVQDTTRPEFVENLPEDITVECDDVPNAATLTAIDNCSDATVAVNDVLTNGNCANNYIIARTWVATDACGLITTHTQIITVQDTTAPAPTTTFEETMDVSCTDVPDAPALEFSDNCSSTAGITVVFEETNTFDEIALTDYQIIRTWTVTDECANQETYTQTLNVSLDEVLIDIVAPDICADEGAVDLNNFTPETLNTNGTWELIEGDSGAILTGSIFDPTNVEWDSVTVQTGIDYRFRYTTTDAGCISITDIVVTLNYCEVLPCGENDIVISKALTPNGDGYNETFDITGIELCGFTANIKIFNRWGALVYESNNYQVGEGSGSWRGSSPKSSIGGKGKLPNGTYYYIIHLENSGLKPLTGPIYLGTK
ncbi:HYR-like domain-containing protein [Hwangdonia lutea]|uniref:HYR domain-containing protein n=1 Tax=Hwangdonia lutea TaxID=3075823 RepID=A0AA97EN57_9FLAO|nr:HYR domain-containing protein [Hwangdonia sp. SCSIO 19198]WOD43058.1 HYR domain-containing protein [Hwangdonia sp. SCSIO 19198]